MLPSEKYAAHCIKYRQCQGCNYMKWDFDKTCAEQFMDEHCILKGEKTEEKIDIDNESKEGEICQKH